MSPPGREPAAQEHHQSGCSRALVGRPAGAAKMSCRDVEQRRVSADTVHATRHFSPYLVDKISARPAPAPMGSFGEHLRSDLAPHALVAWAPAQHPRASSPRSSPGTRSAAAVSRGGSGRLSSNPRPGRSALVLPGGGPMRSVSSPPCSGSSGKKIGVGMLGSAASRPTQITRHQFFAMPAGRPTSGREHPPLGALRGSQGSDAPGPSPGAVVVASRRGWPLSGRSRGEQ